MTIWMSPRDLRLLTLSFFPATILTPARCRDVWASDLEFFEVMVQRDHLNTFSSLWLYSLWRHLRSYIYSPLRVLVYYISRTNPIPDGWVDYTRLDGTFSPNILQISFISLLGQVYYFHPTRRIVTESDIKEPAVHDAFIRSLIILDERLTSRNLLLPHSTELFLDVDITREPICVKYLFVDHAHQNVFWLENTTTESLNCPTVVSYSHLRECQSGSESM